MKTYPRPVKIEIYYMKSKMELEVAKTYQKIEINAYYMH